MNLKIVSYFLGTVLKVEGFALLLPTIVSLCFQEDTWLPILAVAIGSLALGFLLANPKFKKGSYYVREGYTATAVSWILFSLIGALPFSISGRVPSYLDALFETVSGFTTTGASVIADVESLGKGLIFWRSFLHFLGGMGILVFALAILPLNGGYHMQLMKAESPGPDVTKLVPRVKDTAKVLYIIYVVLTLLCCLTYLASGMEWFDALCIGFGTAGTGGFAVRNNGLSDYSVLTQALIGLWMFLFGINFNVYFLILRKQIKGAFSSEEVGVYVGFIVLVGLTIAGLIFFGNYQEGGIWNSLHLSFFHVSSYMTSTGFVLSDTNAWPELAKELLILCMFIGACAGSTGGGLKVSRVLLLIKQAKRELHLLIHPNAVKLIKLEGKTVEHNVLRSVSAYFFLYIIIMIASILCLAIDGFDFTVNFSSVLSALNNIGPNFGTDTIGLFCEFSAFSKIVLIFDMLIGRLELLPILILFYPNTWKKHY